MRFTHWESDMVCKVQILAPILVDGSIKTTGEAMLSDADADAHEAEGRVEILERDGVEPIWKGCCDNHAA